MDKPKDIIIIPRYQVTLRFIEVPSTDSSEIKSMAEFQALKELPYSKEEIITGFRNIGSYKKGFSYIMLAIVKRQLVEEMMAQRGPKPENIKLETELLYLYLLKKSIVKQDKVSLVINIQKDYSEIMIIDKTKPVFSRGLTIAEKTGKGWLEEINRSLISYRRDRNNREIEEAVVMHSSTLSIENIKPDIEAFFTPRQKAPPVKAGMNGAGSGFAQANPAIKDATAVKPWSFTSPVNFYEYKEDLNSISLPLEIDLLPAEYIDKRLSKESARQALVTYFLLFIAVAMLGSFFVFKAHEKNETILALFEKIDRMQNDVGQLNTFLRKTEILKSQKEEGERSINILKECYEFVPQDISLGAMDYDNSGILYCKGTARDMPDVFNFIKALEKSKYFKKVEVKYATKKQMENQEFTDFNIACFTH